MYTVVVSVSVVGWSVPPGLTGLISTFPVDAISQVVEGVTVSTVVLPTYLYCFCAFTHCLRTTRQRPTPNVQQQYCQLHKSNTKSLTTCNVCSNRSIRIDYRIHLLHTSTHNYLQHSLYKFYIYWSGFYFYRCAVLTYLVYRTHATVFLRFMYSTCSGAQRNERNDLQ